MLRRLTEGLNLRQTKDFARSYARQEILRDRVNISDHAFGGSKSRKRITIPLLPPSSKHQISIAKAVKKAGFKVKDYHAGIATDRHGRDVKIGRILHRAGLHKHLKRFERDPARAQAAHHNDLQVVISRHPADIIGQSENCPWKSCMSVGGSNYRFVYTDAREGTHVAYLTKRGDHKARNPLARISLKPHHSTQTIDKDGDLAIAPKHTILHPESQTYGNAPKTFHATVSKWASDNFKPKHFTYVKDSSLYNDDGEDTVRHLAKHHRAAIMKTGGEGIRDLPYVTHDAGKKFNARLYRKIQNPLVAQHMIRAGNLPSKVLVNAVKRAQIAHTRLAGIESDKASRLPDGGFDQHTHNKIDKLQRKVTLGVMALKNVERYKDRILPHTKVGLQHPATVGAAIMNAPYSMQGVVFAKHYHKLSEPNAILRNLPSGYESAYRGFVKAKSTPVVSNYSDFLTSSDTIKHAARVGARGSVEHAKLAASSISWRTDDKVKGAVLHALLKHKKSHKDTVDRHLTMMAPVMSGDKNMSKFVKHVKFGPMVSDSISNTHGVPEQEAHHQLSLLARRITDPRHAETLSRRHADNPVAQAVLSKETAHNLKGDLHDDLRAKLHTRMLKQVGKDIRYAKKSGKDYVFHKDVDAAMVNMHYGFDHEKAPLMKHKAVYKHWLGKVGQPKA